MEVAGGTAEALLWLVATPGKGVVAGRAEKSTEALGATRTAWSDVEVTEVPTEAEGGKKEVPQTGVVDRPLKKARTPKSADAARSVETQEGPEVEEVTPTKVKKEM